jgi:hypothetical protein
MIYKYILTVLCSPSPLNLQVFNLSFWTTSSTKNNPSCADALLPVTLLSQLVPGGGSLSRSNQRQSLKALPDNSGSEVHVIHSGTALA